MCEPGYSTMMNKTIQVDIFNLEFIGFIRSLADRLDNRQNENEHVKVLTREPNFFRASVFGSVPMIDGPVPRDSPQGVWQACCSSTLGGRHCGPYSSEKRRLRG